MSDIETLTKAVVALQSDAKKHLSSVDDRAGQLIDGLQTLHEAVARIERTVNTIEEERLAAFLEATDTLQALVVRGAVSARGGSGSPSPFQFRACGFLAHGLPMIFLAWPTRPWGIGSCPRAGKGPESATSQQSTERPLRRAGCGPCA